MPEVRGYAVQSPTSPLAPFTFSRREPGERDVQIEITYCGVCYRFVIDLKTLERVASGSSPCERAQ